MMKRLHALLITLVMCLAGVGGASAQTTATIGLTQSYSSTDKIFSAPVFTGTSDGSVTNGGESHGSNCGYFNPSIKSRNVVDATGASPVSYAGNHYCWRKTLKTTMYNADQWVGYQLTIGEGKTFSITGAHAEIFVGDNTYTWKLQIAKGTNILYESSDQTASQTKTDNLEIDFSSNADALAKLKNLTGNITVRIYMYQSGSQKYFVIPYLTVTGSVAENAKKTYTVAATSNPENAGTIVGAGSYSEGDAVSVTATPATGYKFVNWTVGESQTSTDNPYSVTSLAGDLNLTANFEALPKISFEKGEGVGTAPNVQYVEKGSEYIIPSSYFLKKDGYTLTGWSDGTNTYDVGSSMTVSGDVVLTPVFTANTVKLGDAEAKVVWNFDKSNGAPVVAFQGNEGDYVEQVEINGTKLDVAMHINTTADGAKVNNETNDTKAQVNGGTIFTLPAVKGMTVSISNGNAFTSTTIAGTTEYEGSGTGSISYTYTGSDATIDIVIGESQYFPSIEVAYPSTAAKSDVTLSIDNDGYATLYYSDRALTVPANAKAYTYKIEQNASGDVLNLSKTYEAGSVIPAGTAVLVNAAEGDYTFTVATTDGVADADNVLKGTDEAATTEGGTMYYMFSSGSKGLGFYWGAANGAAFQNGAHKAYIAYTPSSSSSAKSFLAIGKGATTGIGSVIAAGNGSDDAVLYNLSGQRVGKGYKGIVVRNGSKFVNK